MPKLPSSSPGSPAKVDAPNPAAPTKAVEDVALVCGKSEAGVHIIRKRAERIEAGILRPLEHGKTLDGEVVQLRQRGNTPLFDVDVHFDPRQVSGGDVRTSAAPSQPSKGPPQVASSQYRNGWDLVYRTKQSSTKLLN